MKSNRLSTDTAAFDFIKSNYLILLIFLLGLALRIYDLAGESIWFDEAASVVASKLGIIELIHWIIDTRDGNPPFYYMFFQFWVSIFGDSEFMSRLPSAIFGSLSIFGIYAVGKLLFNKKAGLLAAFILAVSFIHIRYSQEARAYSLMILLSLVSFYCFLKMTSSGKRRYSLIYIVGSVLMLYTHYFAAFLIIVQNIFYFMLYLKNGRVGELDIRRWLKLQVINGLLFLPGFLLWAKIALSIQEEGFWIPEPTVADIYRYLRVYAGSSYLFVIFVIFSVLSVINIRKIRGSNRIKSLFIRWRDYPENIGITNGSVIYLLLLWLFVPILLPYFLSILSQPIMVVRYTLSASLAFYLLTAGGISTMGNKWFILLIAAMISVLSLYVVGTYYEQPYKAQWREAIGDIEASAGYRDVVIIFPHYEKTSAEYYLDRDDLELIAMGSKFPYPKNLGNRSIWIVIHADPENRKQLKLGLYKRYEFVSEKHYSKLDVFRVRERRRE